MQFRSDTEPVRSLDEALRVLNRLAATKQRLDSAVLAALAVQQTPLWATDAWNADMRAGGTHM